MGKASQPRGIPFRHVLFSILLTAIWVFLGPGACAPIFRGLGAVAFGAAPASSLGDSGAHPLIAPVPALATTLTGKAQPRATISDPPAVMKVCQDSSIVLGTQPPVNAQPGPPSGFPEKTLHLAADPALPIGSEGWETIMTEGFEGDFPTGLWTAYDADGLTNGEFYWDEDDYRPHTGSFSAWAANGGANGMDPARFYYTNNIKSWMVYGPFDLSDATGAELLFYYWNWSEANYDWFGWYASGDGTNFSGTCVSGIDDWTSVSFDLTAVPDLGNLTGDSSVWIAFVFTSDITNMNWGPFVDDIVLQKYVAHPNLVPYQPVGWDYPIVPSSVTGTTTVNTLNALGDTYIDWGVINSGATTGTTFTSCLYFDGAEIQCWNTPGGLGQSYHDSVEDWLLNVTPSVGSHTLKIAVDVNNSVSEEDENDNTWERAFTWVDSCPASSAGARLLTVSKTGTGTVTSSPPGIDCGADCSEAYACNTTVTLVAEPAAGAVFAGWDDPACPGTGACAVVISETKTVTASFIQTPPVTTVSFRSIGSQDGWVLESGEFTNVGGTVNAAAATIPVGDDAQNRQQKGILSFNTASLPDDAVITSVTLKLRSAGVTGTNPFLANGNLLVDVRRGAFGGSAALQVLDFQAAASRNAVMTITNNPVNGWYIKGLAAGGFTYINRTGVTQFRLRFKLDDNNDGGVDVLKFYSGNSLTASLRPQLILKYYVLP